MAEIAITAADRGSAAVALTDDASSTRCDAYHGFTVLGSCQVSGHPLRCPPMTISLAKAANDTTDPQDRGVLHVLDGTGDTKHIWDPDSPEEVSAARKVFDELKKKGFQAFSVKRGGEKDAVIRDFDASAGKIIMSPPIRGGSA